MVKMLSIILFITIFLSYVLSDNAVERPLKMNPKPLNTDVSTVQIIYGVCTNKDI